MESKAHEDHTTREDGRAVSQHHVVRCDGPECATEGPLSSQYNNTTVTVNGFQTGYGLTYSVPSNWHQIGGREFCSWRCVAAFAEAMEAKA